MESQAQKMFLRALVMLPIVSASLKALGFQATKNALRILLSTPDPEQTSNLIKTRIALTAHMVNSAGRHGLHGASCLAKSLTLWSLLGRQGIASEVRIGARKIDGKFEAHAWVERNGAALNEPEDHHRHYAAFDKAFASLSQDAS